MDFHVPNRNTGDFVISKLIRYLGTKTEILKIYPKEFVISNN